MTCYFDPSGTTMDVYDHEGAPVAEDYEFGGSWSGDYPNAVLDILYDAREDGRSSYNAELNACMAGEQIEMGTPP